MREIKLNNFTIGGNKLTILAGPCVIESPDIMEETARTLKEITTKLDINFVFKSSFDKANRSSLSNYRGPGLEKGLEILDGIKSKFNLPIVTDIHSPEQAAPVSEVADILQIPAFLCRQTDLLVAAAKTGKIVNIKKMENALMKKLFLLSQLQLLSRTAYILSKNKLFLLIYFFNINFFSYLFNLGVIVIFTRIFALFFTFFLHIVDNFIS